MQSNSFDIMYSNPILLKKVIEYFKSNFKCDDLIADIDYSEYTATSRIKTDNERLFYNAVINYFYFSEINFDSEEQFIQRFNTYWDLFSSKYIAMYDGDVKMPGMYQGGGYTDTRTLDITNTDDSTDTTTPNTTSDTTFKGRVVEIQNTQTTQSGTNTVKTDSTKTNTGTDTLNREDSRETTYNTGDEFHKVMANNAVIYDFVRHFDRLFMEVL